jgi:glucose-6-phosphate 1-dehydrogenase
MPTDNPFQDPLRFERQVPECVVVIFGANGDLTRRKLLPALYRLAYDRRLSAGFAVVGISRTPLTDDQFREKMLDAVKQFSEDTTFDADVWRTFAEGLFYVAGDINDAGLYQRLAARLGEIETARQTGGSVMFYLSTQPSQYARAAEGLGAAGLGKGKGWRRLVVEKPFGTCTKSLTNPTSTASIITWVRKPCRTSWHSASATASSSLCGTAAMWSTCRSRRRNPSASKGAARTTRRPARWPT